MAFVRFLLPVQHAAVAMEGHVPNRPELKSRRTTVEATVPPPSSHTAAAPQQPPPNQPPPNQPRTLVTAGLATVFFGLAYAAVAFGQWPRIVVDPRTGSAEIRADVLDGIGYWGALAWAASAAAVGATVGVGLSRYIGDTARVVLSGLAITTLVVAALYHFWMLWPI